MKKTVDFGYGLIWIYCVAVSIAGLKRFATRGIVALDKRVNQN